MLKNTLGFIILLFLISIFIIALRRNWANTIYQKKWNYSMGDSISKNDVGFSKKLKYLLFTSDRFRLGDLYGKSFLPQFRYKADSYHTFIAPKVKNDKGKIDLYIYGDSFLADKNFDSIFINIRNVYFIDKRFNSTILPPYDTSITNILINEATERSFFVPEVKEEITKKKFAVAILENKFWKVLEEKIFHGLTEQNLEMLLFDYTFYSPIKEIKAMLLFHLFDRINNEVSISNDKKQLYLSITTDPKNRISSTFKISNDNISTIVENWNITYDSFFEKGYDQCFLSIIPNSVSVYEYDLKNYNKKLERIESDKNVKFEIISVYKHYVSERNNVYMKNDAHWNNHGYNIWVKEVNNSLHLKNY